METKKILFQKGNQKVFIMMFITLLLLAFIGLSFAKNWAFSSFEKTAPSKQSFILAGLSDGDIVHVEIGGVSVEAETAKSREKKAKGLSNRYSMNEKNGMLFVFDQRGVYPFWNKDTFIPLDLIWVNNDKIVYIFKYLPVYEGGERYMVTPNEVSNFVLELNAGFVDKYGVKLGDKITISK